MNTPTPEEKERALFAEFHKEYDRLFDKDYMDYRELSKCSIAYANHVLMKQEDSECIKEIQSLEGIVSSQKISQWVSELRKLAALQEQNTNLLGKLATTEQNLAISQERVKKLEEGLAELNQLVKLYEHEDEIESKGDKDCDHVFVDAILLKNKMVCHKCNTYKLKNP